MRAGCLPAWIGLPDGWGRQRLHLRRWRLGYRPGRRWQRRSVWRRYRAARPIRRRRLYRRRRRRRQSGWRRWCGLYSRRRRQ
nr:hypothetical protein [Ralstonia pseudosolanacearum]